ncbi:MAG: glycosyltransferase family 2 protein [Prosthecobacter sp.]|uniref:glycosyltransferase family 2 protein n=1 Tax=Prosthecobacter sp. TaxID=1965333 RepID=UPI0019E2A6D5|nr:glycosyltransferase family A protein [Prosthecobacter sp.]MBE2286881.1 glycosyltransferase family 2 protein [Prosthecobacter sp.]
MTFSIMITTRNRCDDLRSTLTRVATLSPPPVEVIVCADGCTDGTVAMLQHEFPHVLLLVNDAGMGSVASRDRMVRMAAGDWILSLDDDSYPLVENFFSQVGSVIAAHPEAVVITFPEQREGGLYASSSKTPESPGHYVPAYPNCAAVMNRSFYLEQPGFPHHFVHMYEEPDYSLQCYAAGAAVWFEPTLIIRHRLSPVQRQAVRRHHQNARNELWSVWMRCPWPWLPMVSFYRIGRQFCYSCSEGWSFIIREPVWWLAALGGISRCWNHRNTVRWSDYWAWMKLSRRPVFHAKDLPLGREREGHKS